MHHTLKRKMLRPLVLVLILSLVVSICPLQMRATAANQAALYKPQVNGEVLWWGSDQVSAKNQTLRFTGRLNSPSDNYNKAQFYVSLRAKDMSQPWDGPNGGYWIMIDNECVWVRFNNNTLFNTNDDNFSGEPGYSETHGVLQALIDNAGGQKAFYTADHTFEFSAIDENGGVRLIAKIDDTVILNWLDTNSTVTNTAGFSIRTEDVYELYANALVLIGDDGLEMNMLSKEHIGKLSTNTLGFGGYVTDGSPDEGGEATTPDDGNETPEPEKPIRLYKPQVNGEVLWWGSDQVSAKNQTLRFTGRLNSPSDNYNKAQFYISLRAKDMSQPWDGPNGGYWIMIDNGNVWVKFNNNTIFNTADDSFALEPGYSDTRWALQTLLDNAGGQKAFYTKNHDFEFSAIDEKGGIRLIAKIDGTVILNWLDTNKTVPDAGGFSIRTEDVYEMYASSLELTGDGNTMDMLTKKHIGKLSSNSTGFGGYVTDGTPDEGGNTTPPDQGGNTTPPDQGGNTTPPDEGGNTTPPDEGGNTTPPDKGDDSPEKDDRLYKPQVAGELLYWGSEQISAKNQTIRFSGRLNSPVDNYNKAQFYVSLRNEKIGNPWEGPHTGYWIMIDNNCVWVKYDNKTLFSTADNSFASEPGYSDTYGVLQNILDNAGGQKAFYTQYHDFEFSAIDEDGGIRLIAKIDGTVILNWLDTNKTVPDAGGFSVRTEDVYEWYAASLTFAGDDGAQLDMLSQEHIGKLTSNSISFGGAVSTEPLPPRDDVVVDDPAGIINGNYTPDGEFDLSKCTPLDFSTLVGNTYDWIGGIRNHVGRTLFHPNGIEFLESQDKNGGFVKEGATYENFYLDFKLTVELEDAFIERKSSDWIFSLTFRDSDPTKNNWDYGNRNAYALTILYDPNSGLSQIVLRRWNNTTSSTYDHHLLQVDGLGIVGKETTWRIATYTVDEGVRLAVWIDGELIIDVLDRDEKAVRDGGTFMIGQHGTVGGMTVPIVKSIRILGLEKGTDRPVYALGVDEPVPEGSVKYPADVYAKPDVNAAGNTNTSTGTIVIIGVSVAVVVAAAIVFVVNKRKVGKKK